MSCHDIGRGMNEVVRLTISMFDKEEISKEAAIKIIATCRIAVNWCDGNSTEACDYIRNCRCGKCLKLIPKGEKLISLWDIPDRQIPGKIGSGLVFSRNRINEDDLRVATDKLCEECFDRLVPQYYGGLL